jgi:molybdate transport repressor ModE-like protein
MKVHLSPHWTVTAEGTAPQPVDATVLIQLLSRIQVEGSIAAAGRALKLSYRNAWGILRDAETLFGGKLVTKQPGKGTQLSKLANILIQADRRFAARLTPTLESLASELESELRKALPAAQHVVRLFASHGFAVETLSMLIRSHSLPAEIHYRNSSEALSALVSGQCQLAGFHVPVGDFQAAVLQQYRQWLTPDLALIEVATRRQGLFVARGNPLGIAGIDDLKRKEIRFVNRHAGSGTRMLLEMMLAHRGITPHAINGYETAEFTHAAAAAYIASGMAEAGFGVETAARRFDLNFIPLATENYFFATRQEDLELDGVRAVISLLKSEQFQSSAQGLAGYDAQRAGCVISLEKAFAANPGNIA